MPQQGVWRDSESERHSHEPRVTWKVHARSISDCQLWRKTVRSISSSADASPAADRTTSTRNDPAALPGAIASSITDTMPPQLIYISVQLPRCERILPPFISGMKPHSHTTAHILLPLRTAFDDLARAIRCL